MTSSVSRRQAIQSALAGAAAAVAGRPAAAAPKRERAGRVLISTNSTSGNEIAVYDVDDGGNLSYAGRQAAGGLGTSGGLGSQGAVTVSRNGRYLFAVNAGSNSVSAFRVRRYGLERASVVDSGGLMPTSVAEHNGLVFVLNAGGSGNVAGFRNQGGQLRTIAGSARGLSASGGTAPAQVGFSDDGATLVVSERSTSVLTSWRVRGDGTLEHRTLTPSPGATPFGFAFTRRNRLIVSEATASSVSSYRFAENAPETPILVTAALPTTQAAACWISVTPDGRFAYSANAGSSSVSAIGVGRGGELTLLAAQAGLTGTGAGALDMAVSPDGEFLHVFASRALAIVTFAIGEDGLLTPAGSIGGVIAGSAGLAAI